MAVARDDEAENGGDEAEVVVTKFSGAKEAGRPEQNQVIGQTCL